QASDAVSVDVLRCAFQLGEHREVVAGVGSIRMRDLQQHGAVALNDERAVSHNVPVYRRCELRSLSMWKGGTASRQARLVSTSSTRLGGERAGETPAMLDRGRVRSISELRSRARSRPPTMLAGSSCSSVIDPSGMVTLTVRGSLPRTAASSCLISQ